VDIGRVTTSGWSISTSGGTVSESKYAAWADGKSASLMGATKPGFPCGKSRPTDFSSEIYGITLDDGNYA